MKNYIFYPLLCLVMFFVYMINNVSPKYYIPYLIVGTILIVYAYNTVTTENLRRCYVWLLVVTYLVPGVDILSTWILLALIPAQIMSCYYLAMDISDRINKI